MDPLFLGTSFDEAIQVGTIVGSPDAVVIPEVAVLGQVLVPEVRADTRTGTRLTAQVQGRAGLELSAGLDLGGLAGGPDGAAFQFNPTLDVPEQIHSGAFFSLQGSSGLDADSAFAVEHIRLPQASMQLDVIFDVRAAGRIDYGFVGAVPYRSQPFDWNMVPQPTDDTGNWTLLGLTVDLNDRQNFGALTVAGNEIAIDPGQNGTLFSYDISLDAPGAQSSDPPLFNRDVGSLAIARPELGNTMFVETNLDPKQGISYSVDYDLLRLGVDIDGIASTLAAGASYTDFSQLIGQAESDIHGSIDGTVVDLKYGPELGYRYESTIHSNFDVTLSFSEPVAVKDANGQVTITDSVSGSWNQLPEIALLGTDDVEVEVAFTRYEASRSDRGALTIGDFLEFQALALSANLNIGPLSVELAGIGPAIHERTNLLGEALGEAEIELFENNNQPLVDAPIAESGRFVLGVAPSHTLYLPAATNALDNPASWRKLGTDEPPTTLAGNTLVIAVGTSAAATVTELTPATLFQSGGPHQTIAAREVQMPSGATLILDQGASRRWEVMRFQNDGTYLGGFQSATVFAAGPSGLLTLGGEGIISLTGSTNRIEANIFVHESGHTLLMGGPSGSNALAVSQSIHNAGTMRIGSLDPLVIASAANAFRGIENQGTFEFFADNSLQVPEIRNEGRILVHGPDNAVELQLRPYFRGLTSSTGQGALVAGENGTIRFPEGAMVRDTHTLQADTGGTLQFDRLLSLNGARVNVTVEPGGAAIFNGIDVFNDGTLDIINRGVVTFASGDNVVSSPAPGGGTIDPVNIDNEQGRMVVEAGAGLFFSAVIRDYSGGGATFDAGEWELIGSPWLFDNREQFGGVNPPPREDLSQVILHISEITNDQTTLGNASFDDPSYNFEEFDTSLKINASKVTLSGAANFPYLNTVEENRGTINLREGIRFHTAGDLRNSGEIRVENGARLNVTGDLLIHGGSMRIAGRSGLEGMDYATLIHDALEHKIEVVGGELVFGEDGFLQVFLGQFAQGVQQFALLGDWTVRESVERDAETGAELTRGARIDLGAVDRIFRYSNGTMTLDGAHVEFDAIRGLSRLEPGRTKATRLELLGGFKLSIDNDLLAPVQPGGPRTDALLILEGTELLIDTAGRLETEMLIVDGTAVVGRHGSLTATYQVDVGFNAAGAALRVDGLLEAQLVQIGKSLTETGTTEAGRLSGNGQLVADVLLDGGTLVISSPTGAISSSETASAPLVIHGALAMSADARMEVSLRDLGPSQSNPGLLVTSAELNGTLAVEVDDAFRPRLGDSFAIVGLLDSQGSMDGEFLDLDFPVFHDLTFAMDADSPGITLSVVPAPGVEALCDVDGNGVCDVGDIDAQTAQMLAGHATLDDRRALIENPMPRGFETFFGDANLDGRFASDDLIQVLAAGEYQDEIPGNSGWGEGDWDGDGDFATGDFILAFQSGAYEQGPRAALVPEPTSVLLLLTAILSYVAACRPSRCG